jgi:hypothetical protein
MGCSITIRQQRVGRAKVERELTKSGQLNDYDSQVKRTDGY